MPEAKYVIKLSEEETKMLKEITHKGSKNSAKTILHPTFGSLRKNKNN